MLVYLMKPSSMARKLSGHGEHGREPIAESMSNARDPVPELEQLACRCELVTCWALVETATKCLAVADLSPFKPPAASHARCARWSSSPGGEVLEETMNNVSRDRGLSPPQRNRPIDIRDEAEGHVAQAVVLQRFVGHDRAEIRAPMPILITLRMRLPEWPFQAPLRNRWEKSAILSRQHELRARHCGPRAG